MRFDWQIDAAPGDRRIGLNIVLGISRWWVAYLREFLSFGTPTIALWVGAHGFRRKDKHNKLENTVDRVKNLVANTAAAGVNLLIRAALPFRRVLIAKSLSEISGVLNEQLE